MNSDFLETLRRILDNSEKMLYEYPLCNSCLGRFFTKYGIGLSNYERGQAIKTLLVIKLHEDHIRGLTSREYIHRLALNAGEELASMYRKLYGEDLKPRSCFICGNKLTSDFLSEVAWKACNILRNYDAGSFIVGLIVDKKLLERELEIMVKYGLESSESIKRELKREIGKTIATTCSAVPDFEKPDVVLMIKLRDDFNYDLKIQINPLLYIGRYWKLGRNISHIPWYTKNGSKKYPLSIQEAVEGIFKEVFNAEEVIIHAAGREDVDARMLGSGRPLVVEVKAPKRRKVELNELRSSVMRSLANIPVVLHIDSQTTRSSVALIKEYSKRKRKIYRLTVFVDGELGEDDLRKIEEYFANREIVQRTPIRILKRKKDRERRRKVYSVKTHRISSRIFEALVYCDGGLYVKELVHCDEGRTKPCFSEILAKKTVPIELDVLYVEE